MFSLEQLEKAMPKQTFELFAEGFAKFEEMALWTLVGGTALSIHYHHRLSEDLDFFIKHSTLEQSRKTIFSMMKKLEDNGFDVVKVKEDERNLDFEIFGVKVTFFASGVHSLKENAEKYEHIEVASVNTIMAMKMDAIINYRTKSRDFYDVYTIAQHKNISIFTMLDAYNIYSHTKTKESELLHRFLEKKLDKDDEGLSEMRPQEQISFVKLRQWLKKEIKQNKNQETSLINDLLQTPSLMAKYKTTFFGFERMSLLQKFASIYELDMVLKCLELADFDMTYTNIAGKNILDYYVDDEKTFKLLLSYAHEIPDEWMNSRMYKSKGLMPLILLENSLITCIRNGSNRERIIKVASARELEIDVFFEMIEVKRSFLDG
jgi:hypothetical protein